QRIAIKAIAEPLPGTEAQVFLDGQGVDIAVAASIEIARSRVMNGMQLAPAVVRGESKDAATDAQDIVDLFGLEVRAVAAIMLNDEHAHEQSGGRQRQPQGQ